MVAAHKVMGLEMPKLQLLVSEIATPEGYEYEKTMFLEILAVNMRLIPPRQSLKSMKARSRRAARPGIQNICKSVQFVTANTTKMKDTTMWLRICSGSSHETEDHDEYTASKAEKNLLRRSLKEGLRSIQRACLTQAVHEEQVYERLKPFQAKGSVPTYLSPVELEIERDYTLPALPKEKPPRLMGRLWSSQSLRGSGSI